MTAESLALLVGIAVVLLAVASRVMWQSWRGKGPLVHREYLREPPPDGYGVMVAGGVPVKGVSFSWRQRRLRRFARGQDRQLELTPQPDNRHDPNAIQVTGRWRSEDGKTHGPADLGWVPKELAADMADAGLSGSCAASLTCVFHARWPAFHGLRIAIWTPDQKGETSHD